MKKQFLIIFTFAILILLSLSHPAAGSGDILRSDQVTLEAIVHPPPAEAVNRELKPIFFDFNQAALRSDQLPRLEDDFTRLNCNPALYILIGGHTDERGSRQYNLKLSARRAAVIKKYLVERGIAPERITIYAYGKAYPAKVGHGEFVWKANRRTDIITFETPPTREQGILNWDGASEIP